MKAYVLGLLLAPATPVPTLTLDEIRTAIEYGKSAERLESVNVRQRFGELCGTVSTPAMRVAAMAHVMAKEYKTLKAEDVSKNLVEPTLWALARPLRGGGITDIAGVRVVVVMPRGSKDAAQAIHATQEEPEMVTFTNGFGASATARQVLARFPLSVLSKDNEVRFVYEGGQECVASLDPEVFADAVPVSPAAIAARDAHIAQKQAEADAKKRAVDAEDEAFARRQNLNVAMNEIYAGAPSTRARACRTLGEFGPEAAMAVTSLVDALTDREPVVRIEAARALANIGGPRAEAALVAAASNKKLNIQSEATEALAQLRSKKEPTP